MNAAKYLIDFAVTFAIVFLVSVVVTFLYSLLVHGSAVVEWETSFRFGLILGIALPLINQRKNGGSK